MGRDNKKDIKQKLRECAYRKRKLSRRLTCLKKSMDEVCEILNPRC